MWMWTAAAEDRQLRQAGALQGPESGSGSARAGSAAVAARRCDDDDGDGDGLSAHAPGACLRSALSRLLSDPAPTT